MNYFRRTTSLNYSNSHWSLQIHFSEVEGLSEFGTMMSTNRKLVVMRLVSGRHCKADALRQVRRLSVLRDPSIAKVVAVTLHSPAEDTWGVMTEYLEGGHLPVYLRQYRFGSVDNFDPGVKTIRSASLHLHKCSNRRICSFIIQFKLKLKKKINY